MNKSGNEIGMRAVVVNAAVAAFFGVFAYRHAIAFQHHPRASLAIVIMVELLIAAMFMVRSPSSRTSTSPWDWFAGIAGTLFPLLLRPVDAASDSTPGQILQLAAGMLAVAALIALNRSIGAVPADRGIKSRGMYRFVRHPLYCAYTIGNVGYLLSNPSARNFLIVLVATALHVARIFNEERLLGQSAEYREYQARTRWRLLPGIF